MGMGRIFLLVWICLCTWAAVREAEADFYKYTDEKGAVCLTDRLEDVPPAYRARVKVIREQTLADKDQEAQKRIEPPLRSEAAPAAGSTTAPEAKEAPDPAPRPEAVAPFGMAGRFDRLAADYPWFKPLAIIGAILLAFVVVIKVADLLPSPQLARLLYVAFFLGTFTFAYVTYVNQMSSSFVGIKQKVLTMFKKANEREGLRPERRPDPE